ncbi:unnamed protein product [Microthlaspi erraticum]|uniref:F-box domain-containing protein n=1 Tax=Microthlaspi erraticum TaxID=1685480 RepID=A0A6D2KFD3_9BRAS|nr:unnamed protein product [Microthlaspi erraticum]
MENLEQQFSENILVTSRRETQSSNSVREYYSDPILVDLLIDIFSRVPGESIDRFRCVSKFWRYILRRPDFTELFLTKSPSRPRILFTLVADGKSLFYSSPQPENFNDNSTLVATRYRTSFPQSLGYCFYTPVYGLALLHGYNKRSVICNPITGESLTLPEVEDKSNRDREAEETFYLGYDPISKQFKVLCVTWSRCERPTTYHVLTLEPGKPLWRRIQCKFHFMENHLMSSEVCINGVLYFGAKLGQSWVIVRFDVRSEEFGFIRMGNRVQSNFCAQLKLFNYKGKLGIRQQTKNYWDKVGELVLWVLKNARHHKWSKQTYEPPNLMGEHIFVGMTNTGEIVFSPYYRTYRLEPYCLHFYNPERSNTLTRVVIQGFEEFKHHSIVTLLDYVENVKFM